MASYGVRHTATSTVDATSYTGPTFTPAVGDLLVVTVVASDTVAAGSLSSSEGYTFDKITSAVYASGANTIYLFVATGLVTAAVSQSVTFDCTGDAATGRFIAVHRVTGMVRAGAAAVRQTAKVENQAAAGTPEVTFSTAALTTNLILGVVGNSSNPAGMTPPSTWTARGDNGYDTPTTGVGAASKDNGFTSTAVTWGGASATVFGALAVELDASPNLSPSLFTNVQTFYAPIVTFAQTMAVPLLSNTQTFYPAGGVQDETLLAGLITNAQEFFSPGITQWLHPNKVPGSTVFFRSTLLVNGWGFVSPVSGEWAVSAPSTTWTASTGPVTNWN
jgi:hypothetical protein